MDRQAALTEKPPTPKVAITSNIILQEISSFFYWWYIEVPSWYLGFFQRIALICDDSFSISLLLRTFFVPWHRDSSWIGRMFGILIRIIYLPIAICLTLIILLILFTIAAIWAVLPLLAVLSILRSPFIR